MTDPIQSVGSDVRDSGAVASRDVVLRGTNVAGRDVIIHQTVQATSAPTVLPSELPLMVADFVDRHEDIRRLCALLEESITKGDTSVAAICGPPGVGKTALALCVAHRVRNRFDGGNLFMDLSGGGETPLQPSAVLGEFLLALGVSRIPQEVEDQARLYRSALARARYLVLLDNARDEQQIRPLLPGAIGCAALITSRRRLALPESTQTFVLNVLDDQYALEMLSAVLGIERVTAQAADAYKIVHSCGGFPLALRIAAARLAGRPYWRLSRLAERLADERYRLGELHMGDAEVRAGFAMSYEGLQPQARRLFRLLGLVNVLDFAAWLPAALLDTSPDQAEELAEQLCEAHLLQVDDVGESQPRYRFHDLLRAFARERLEAESDGAERNAALSRVLGAYVGLVMHADASFSEANSATWDRLHDLPASVPPDYLLGFVADPLQWFAKERANLLRVIEQAHQTQRWRLTWQMASAMWQFFEITARWTEWRTAYRLALDAARQAGDAIAEGSCLRLLGRLELARGDVGAATDLFDRTLVLLSTTGDLHGRCMVLKDKSVAERLHNRHSASTELLLSALDGFRQLGEGYWVAIVRRELGIEYRYMGQWSDAEGHFTEAISTFERLGEQLQEAQTRFELGVMERLRGNWATAQQCFHRASPVFDRLHARGLTVWTLRELALVAAGEGETDAAVETLLRCLQMWRELDDWRQYAGTVHELALIRQRRGEVDDALVACREAIDTFHRIGDALSEARALITYAVLSVQCGSAADAVSAVERALPSFRANEDLLWEVKSQRALAAAYTALGDARAARDATVLADGLTNYVRAADETRI